MTRAQLFVGLGTLVALALTLASCSAGSSPSAQGVTYSTSSTSSASSAGSSTIVDVPAPVVSTASTAPSGILQGPVGYKKVTVTVTRPGGIVESYCLWLAETEEERVRGLMQVTDPSLGGLPGMLFVYQQDSTGGFWMKNTVLPLSIAYIGADGKLVSSTDMEPCSKGDSCPSYPPKGPYRYAVEVPKGMLGAVGLDVPGSTLAVGERSCGRQ